MGAGTIYNGVLKVAHDGHHKPRNCPNRYRSTRCTVDTACSRPDPRVVRACGSWGRLHTEAPTTSEGGPSAPDAARQPTVLEALA